MNVFKVFFLTTIMTIFIRNLLILGVSISYACNDDLEHDYFSAPDSSKKNIKLSSIQLDTIHLDSLNTSFDGFLEVEANTLLYIDRRFGWIYELDSSGTFISKFMGIGGGPSELNTGYIDGYLKLNNRNRLFFGSSFDIHVHNQNFQRESENILNTTLNPDMKKVRSSSPLDPNEFLIYTLNYGNFILRQNSKNEVFFPIHCELKTFNGFRKEYYENSRILAKMTLSPPTVTKVLGRFSPEFQRYEYIPHHQSIYYDINNSDEFAVGFEIDSSIYIYDSKYKPVEKFGFEGIDMDKDYYQIQEAPVNSDQYWAEYRDKKGNDRPNRGYYHNIEYISETNYLFRSYKKSKDSKYDGLQIYEGNSLIADIEVPKNLIVKGYIPPYYYSDIIIDEDAEDISFYKFKLNLHE